MSNPFPCLPSFEGKEGKGKEVKIKHKDASGKVEKTYNNYRIKTKTCAAGYTII